VVVNESAKHATKLAAAGLTIARLALTLASSPRASRVSHARWRWHQIPSCDRIAALTTVSGILCTG
jgi:hypothetical protein